MTHESFRDTKNIDGVIVKTLAIHDDSRGWLCEMFRSDESGGDIFPAMGYMSVTMPGKSRGPHEHKEQTDMFCFLGPGQFLVALWDGRANSPTRNARMIELAGETRKCIIVVPPGVVHAYCNTGKVPAYTVNFPNRLYAGKGHKEKIDEIRHEDDGTMFASDFERLIKERLK